MKKLFAVALLIVLSSATAASAIDKPLNNRFYTCYYTNNTSNAISGGLSIFSFSFDNGNLIKGIEYYEATTSTGLDNRKVAFDTPVYHLQCPAGTLGQNVDCTEWTYTQNPSGPQCLDTYVLYDGAKILFKRCSDGHSRTCFLF